MSQIGKLQTWKIPVDKLDNWRRLNPNIPKEKATDCVINSLHFLGVIDNPEFASILSNYANTNERGIYDPEILQLIFNKFNEGNQNLITNHTIGSKMDRDIRNELENNTYTIAIFRRLGAVGHAVILTKQNNIMYVLDPQQEEVICEFTNYIDWVNNQGFVNVEYILKNKITRKRNDTKISLRKQKTISPPTKKRRLNSKNKSKSRSNRKSNSNKH